MAGENCWKPIVLHLGPPRIAWQYTRAESIDVFPVWNAWGHALIRMERSAQARLKFKQALQLYKGELAPVITEIINTIEGGPPVDNSAARSMYEHLAKSAPTILDDSLSACSYLNVMYMPSTFPQSERSMRSQESTNNKSSNNSFLLQLCSLCICLVPKDKFCFRCCY